jgi:hypothetical protein
VTRGSWWDVRHSRTPILRGVGVGLMVEAYIQASDWVKRIPPAAPPCDPGAITTRLARVGVVPRCNLLYLVSSPMAKTPRLLGQPGVRGVPCSEQPAQRPE